MINVRFSIPIQIDSNRALLGVDFTLPVLSSFLSSALHRVLCVLVRRPSLTLQSYQSGHLVAAMEFDQMIKEHIGECK